MKKPGLWTEDLKEKLLERYDTIILASGSNNRVELLKAVGIKVIVKPQKILELCDKKIPEDIVRELSFYKLESYLNNNREKTEYPVLSADTLVVFENQLYGKPKDMDDAFNTLLSFSGKTHKIITGISLFKDGKITSLYDESIVTFKTLDKETIREYLKLDEWKGAAGSYKIQKEGFNLVKSFIGSFSNAIGLPLEKLLI